MVVNRFRLEDHGPAEEERFRGEVQAALEVLATRPGYLDGRVGRNLDDPALWVLVTTWDGVGSYRRALSSYDVKVGAVGLLSRAVDEPSAYEDVEPGGTLNRARARELG
jgi:antibiotic biosynthesis monooxygenase